MKRRTTLLVLATIAAPAIVSWANLAEAGVATESCGRQQSRAAVTHFLGALAARKPGEAASVFAEKPAFQWYSTTAPGARSGRAAYKRIDLERYFATRSRVRETLRIVRWNFIAGRTPQDTGVNGTLVRAADDLPATRFGFKAAIRCDLDVEPKIVVWSMARAITR